MTSVSRVGAICLAGLAWLAVIVVYQRSYRLMPAPMEIQDSGRQIIGQELAALELSDFGGTERGRLIIAEVRQLLARNQIQFAPMSETRGLTWDPILGGRIVYIKVIEMAKGRFLHQRPQGIMEALVHESVHAIRKTRWRVSVDEECDCFAAGIEVGHIVAGVRPPVLLEVDGQPVATFVMNNYPTLRRSADYSPVGQSREWLARRTGLGGVGRGHL